MKFYLVLAVFCITFTFTFASFSQTQTAKPYDVVEIGEFTSSSGLNLDESDLNQFKSYLMLKLDDSRRFEKILLRGAPELKEGIARRVRISGVITRYDKGSNAGRLVIGMGVGKAELEAEISLFDVETGKVLLTEKIGSGVKRFIVGSTFAVAQSKLASEIIKIMVKHGYAKKRRSRN